MLAKLFDYDNVVFRFIAKVGYIWWLNILWLICSLPVITMGASTTALIYSCMKLQKEEGYPTANFFKSFKENFAQATVIFFLAAIVGALLAGDLIYWNQMDNSNKKLIWAVTIALMVPYCLTLLYVFAVQSKFVNKIKRTIQYSFVLSIKYFKYTFPMLVIVAAVIYVNAVTVVAVNFITLNIGIGITVYLLALYYSKIFAHYIEKDKEEVIGNE